MATTAPSAHGETGSTKKSAAEVRFE